MLGLERSGYYAFQKRKPGKRAQANEALDKKMSDIFNYHKGRYGAPPRLTAELQESRGKCSKNVIVRPNTSFIKG